MAVPVCGLVIRRDGFGDPGHIEATGNRRDHGHRSRDAAPDDEKDVVLDDSPPLRGVGEAVGRVQSLRYVFHPCEHLVESQNRGHPTVAVFALLI